MINRKYLFFITLFMLISVSAAFAGKIEVKISGNVQAESDKIYLGEIAEITEGHKSTIRMQNVFIAKKPADGQYIRLSRNILRRKIFAAGFKSDEFELEAPAAIKIHPGTAVVESLEIIEAAVEWLKQSGKWEPDYEMIYKYRPDSVSVPAGSLEFECSIKEEGNPLKVAVDIIVDGRNEQTSKVWFKQPEKPDPVETMPNNNQQADPGSDNLASMTRNTEGVKVVYGQPLKIFLVRNNLRVVVYGTASQTGKVGEYIRVKINGRNKKYNALLIKPDQALIEI